MINFFYFLNIDKIIKTERLDLINCNIFSAFLYSESTSLIVFFFELLPLFGLNKIKLGSLIINLNFLKGGINKTFNEYNLSKVVILYWESIVPVIHKYYFLLFHYYFFFCNIFTKN